MRTRLASLFLLLSVSAAAQHNLSSAIKGSTNTYIYRLNTSEANVLYRKGLQLVSENYLHTLVDSFQKSEPALPAGNYLFVRAIENELHYSLHAEGDVQYKLVNNDRDLVVVLHNRAGVLLNSALAFINNKPLHYDAATQTYRRDNYTKEGELRVVHEGTVHAFSISKGYAPRLSFWQTVAQTTPFRQIILPFKKLFGKQPRYNSFFYNTAYEQGFKGFLVFNQPTYKPHDTVRLKAFVATKNGKPLNKKLWLRVSERNGEVDTLLAVLTPYRPGGFVHSFVLSDSLHLSLDADCLLTLEEEPPRRTDEDDEKEMDRRKVVQRGRFRYEDYELNAVTFSARCDKQEHSRAEEAAVYLRAADANGLAVLDGRVEVLVKPLSYSQKTYSAPQVFLPDTLWRHEQPLEPIGETKIILPDSIFPAASFNYEVECIFLNADNERRVRTLYQSFLDQAARIHFTQREDSLTIDYLVGGQPQPARADLYGYNSDGDTLVRQQLQLPVTIGMHPFVRTYEARTDTTTGKQLVSNSNLVSALATRTKDSVFIQLVNPRRLPVWYTVLAGKKVVLRGYGDSLLYAARTHTPKHYFISLQYLFNDQVYNQDFTVPYRDRLLNVRLETADAVYPGKTAPVAVVVTDAENRPVANADVTAYAFTQKFENIRAPFVPYLGKLYPGRKRYDPFREGSEVEETYSEKLVWERWSRELHLDTVEYYKFLRPQTLYVNTEAAPDSQTQLAPFVVKNGEPLPVHQLYLDEVPLYFSAAQTVQRYSFPVSPGKHALRLRTPTLLVSLDSFDVPKGVKTFVSINADTANHRVRLKPMPDMLTPDELNLWSRYMLLIENTFGESYASVSSGPQTFLLPQHSSSVLTGPVAYNPSRLVVRNGFTQSFAPEGGYRYLFREGLIKQQQLRNPYPFSKWLSAAKPRHNFADYVLTEKEVDSLWLEYLYHRSAEEGDLFYNQAISKHGNGSLHIGLTKDSAGKDPFVRNVLLFRSDNPDFLRIYHGEARDLGFLQPGTYRLFFLLRDDAYVIRDSIHIRKDGINHYDLSLHSPKPQDSVSRSISETINRKSRWQYRPTDLDAIKESFNSRYFDAAHLTDGVSGTVRDDKGVPVANASVVMKGTRTGATTNAYGQFFLKAIPTGTLVVTSVGYKQQEVRLHGAADYPVTLSPTKQELQEVVVIGYGTSRHRDVTGAVSSVNGYLEGRLPGVMIRGDNSVALDSSPLYVVDGLPYAGTNKDLDPSLIVKMTVLKDAAATALYGARGANGVVLITTKGADAAGEMNGTGKAASSLRRNFRDYAYWQPALKTGADGRASFTVTYPDDITAWRSFALAVTDHRQSGQAETLVRSFKALSASLALPQFAVAGDTLTVVGKALNYLPDTVDAVRRFAVNSQVAREDHLRFRNAKLDTLRLVAPVADSLKLAYTVQKTDGYFDGEERSIPVFRRGVPETAGVFAALRGDTTFTLQPLSDTGRVLLYAEASVLPVMEKEIESIRRYEYLCNEQLASKLKALLVQKRIDSFYRRPFRGDRNIRELLDKLSQSKSATGLWGWWSGNEPAMWISLHVLEALVQADAQGYKTALNRGAMIDYLVFNMESYRKSEQLSALHLLHLLGAKADFRRYTDTLQKTLADMNLYEKLRLAELKQKAGLEYTIDSLLKKQSRTMLGNVYWGEEGKRFFDNAIQNTLAMYRILKRTDGHEAELEKMRGYFLERRRSGTWRNTYESSLILETILPDLLVNDSLPAPATLSLDGAVTQTVTHFPFAAEQKISSPLTVHKTGALPVYFTAYQQHWNAAPQKVAGDFSVQSAFVQNGDTVAQLKAGGPVQLTLTVTVKADASYVLIEAPIPAGCSYNGKPQPWTNNEVHREYFKNKVSLFCSELKKGKYTFTIPLQPRYSGRYTLNPARVELMYFPVFYGREEMKSVRIR